MRAPDVSKRFTQSLSKVATIEKKCVIMLKVNFKGELQCKKYLKNLWYGNLCPIEKYRESQEQASDLIKYMCKHRNDLNATFSDEQKVILEKLDDCEDELEMISHREIFTYAFRLGARIAIEVMSFQID